MRYLALIFSFALCACFSGGNPYAVYYGDTVALELKPTGDKKCDELRQILAKALNGKMEAFYKEMSAQRQNAENPPNRGLASSPEAEMQSRGYREAGVEIGERMGLRSVISAMEESSNTILQARGCVK